MNEQEYHASENEQKQQDQLLSELLQKFTLKPSTDSSNSNAETQSAGGVPSSDILSSLLSNTDLISKLPQIISTVKPLLEAFGKSSATPPTPSDRSVPASALPASPAAALKAKNDSDRAALLCAMKPYLSHDRQNAIDYIIKLSRLGDILKTL